MAWKYNTDEVTVKGNLDINLGVYGATAATTLTAADNGKTIVLNSTTEFDVILPARKAGLRFTFIVGGAPASASYTITAADADTIIGQIYTLDVDSTTNPDFEATGGGDVITFVDSKAVAGDSVELICDGSVWYARCFCSAFDAITITG